MVSKLTNASAFLNVMSRSSYTAGKTANEKNISNFMGENEIVRFRSLVGTDTGQNLIDQNAIFHFDQLSKEDKALLSYNGSPISELSVEEAGNLIRSDGYFGVEKTSQRIADFVIQGAGDDIERLKAGREGVLQGIARAEKAWGGKLPEISYETLAKSLAAIDDKLRENGEPIVDILT